MTDFSSRPFPRNPLFFGAQGEEIGWDDLNGEALQTIADEIGIEKALEICVNFSGVRLYIPKVLIDSHPIVIIGREAAFKLCRAFGPSRIEIPIQALTDNALRRFVEARIKAGQSNSKVALALGISWRTVSRFTSDRLKARRGGRAAPASRLIKSDGRLTLTGAQSASPPKTNHEK